MPKKKTEKDSFLKKHGLNLAFWAAISFSFLLFLFGPSLYRWSLGYQLEIDFKEDIKEDKEKDGKKYVMIEVNNVGGYDLHNVKGNLTFMCYSGKNIRAYGGGKLEGFVETLGFNSGPKALLFDDERLIKFVDGLNQNNKNCADSVLVVFTPKKTTPNLSELEYVLLFEYLNKTDNITRKIVKDIVVKDNVSFFDVSFKLCTRCVIHRTIGTKEKIFTQVETHSYTPLKMNSLPIAKYLEAKMAGITATYFFEVDPKSCRKKEGLCQDYVINKVIDNFNITYLSQDKIMGEEAIGIESCDGESCIIELPVYPP